MDLAQLIGTFRVATNDDVPRIVAQANADPRLIYARDMFHDNLFTLEDVADGPYTLEREEGYFILVGFDKKTGVPAKARIVGETVQLINHRFTTWTPVSMESVRLYVLR